MKIWNKKMKSSSGASFLLALAFFLVCSLAGSSILTMAQAYGKRIDRKQREEAEYLAVMSAVEFTKEQIGLSNGLWETESFEEYMENEVQKELLREVMEVCRAYCENKTVSKHCILKLSLENGSGSGNEMGTVEVRLSVKTEDILEQMPQLYEEEAELELIESSVPILLEAEFFRAEGQGYDDNVMNMTVYGTAVCEMEESGVGHRLSAVDLQWDKPAVAKGGADKHYEEETKEQFR